MKVGHVARLEVDVIYFGILKSNPIGKRALGSPRQRYNDIIKIYL